MPTQQAATYKGVLLPQVALTSTIVYGLNTAGSAAAVNGILVYNTATTGSDVTDVIPGVYIWQNGIWNLLTLSASSATKL